MKQIAVKISDQAHDRLQRLAHQGKVNYATIVESAIMQYPSSTSETSETSKTDWQGLIDAALVPVLERLAALESVGLVKPLSPEQGIVVTVESAHQGGDLGASEGQAVVEVGLAGKAAEIASQAGMDSMERERASSSILPKERTVKEFVADLVAAGERSPTAIAKALTAAGYRTGTGSEFQRSNPQIKAALDQVRG